MSASEVFLRSRYINVLIIIITEFPFRYVRHMPPSQMELCNQNPRAICKKINISVCSANYEPVCKQFKSKFCHLGPPNIVNFAEWYLNLQSQFNQKVCKYRMSLMSSCNPAKVAQKSKRNCCRFVNVNRTTFFWRNSFYKKVGTACVARSLNPKRATC